MQLKAFLHVGEIVVKRARQFEEIAGEAVIMVYRMTKNSVPLHEHVLMSEATRVEGGATPPDVRRHSETIDGVPTLLHWCGVDALTQCLSVKQSSGEMIGKPLDISGVQRVATFSHLPAAEQRAKPGTWWEQLWHRYPRA